MPHNDRYRQDHDKMRASAELPADRDEPEPIPGEHDHETEAPTPPGIVGGTGFGNDLPPTNIDPTLNEEDRKQIRWEAGGRVPQKKVDLGH